MALSRRRPARARAIIVALALAVGAGLVWVPTGAVATTVPAAAIDGLTEEDCPVDVPPEHADRVTCGVLVVPESRAAGSDPEKTLRLPVAVIASRSPNPAPDPLVFPTAGGPGSSTFGTLWFALDYADWAAEDRDIIVVEQRGDAAAEPSLDCPELDAENRIVGGVWLTGTEGDELRTRLTAQCRARLADEGTNFAGYTSAESAADLADLRAALGYDQWNIYGVSYGARLAMTVMRDHPTGLRAVILDGAYPLDVNRFELLPTGFRTALDALFAACAADADCHDRYPELEQNLSDLLDSAADSPLTVSVKSPADRSAVRLDIHDTDITGGLFNALYDAWLLPVLPFVIDQLARGDTESAVPLAQNRVDAADLITEGLYLSVECAEEAPFNDPAVTAAAMESDPILQHFAQTEGPPGECPAWGVPPLGAVENQAVASGIPTLLASGGYDPVTPYSFTEAAAAQLSAARVYVFPTMAHGPVWQNWVHECPASIAQQFLRDPAAEPDSSCIEAMPPTDFLTTSDIHPSTAIYRFNSDVVEDRDPVQIGIAAITLAILVGTLGYALVYAVAWLVRRRGNAPAGAVLAAATASGLNVAFAAALAFVLLNTNPLILAFGIPPAARPLVIAPLIALAVTVLLAIVMIRAWVGGDGTLFHRVVLSLSAVASLGFIAWVIARGLLIF